MTDVVVEMRMTGFSTAVASDEAAVLSDETASDDAAALALDAEADSLDADALEALPEPLEHATMNRASIAANTAASRALDVVDLFIVSLPFYTQAKLEAV